MGQGVSQPVRLNLGCGNKHLEGWVNVDLPGNYSGLQPDVEADLRDLPFPADYADEVMAVHVIEHFHVWEAQDVIREWARVLKPGGRMVIECPSLPKVMRLFDVPQVPPEMTYWALYGDPSYKNPTMVHKWCYGPLQLARLMTVAGIADAHEEPARFHQPIRDMRVVGVKFAPETKIEVAR